MQRSAVQIARFLGFIEMDRLNPGGKVFFPRAVSAIAEKLNFQKFPVKPEEFDETKGVEFHEGHWNGMNVSKLVIYNNGLLVDTKASTDDSERILIEALSWAREELGIAFSPQLIYRKRYLSDVIFQTEAPILDGFSPIENLKRNLTNHVAEVMAQKFEYSSIRLDVDFERFQRQAAIAPFTIQRRNDSLFGDNRYFSEAPLPTEVHWQVLEQYEKDVLSALR